MTREEAIERVRSRFDKWALDNEDLTALQVLGLVDAESEDERMLREIKRYIKEQGDKPTELPNGTVAVSDMIDWLEKQKELTTEDIYNAAHECIYGEEKQKEQKPHYCHHEVDETGWSEEYCKAYYDGWNNCNMQHEQAKAGKKPAEKQDYSGLNDLERAIHRGFLCAGVENVPVGIIKDTAAECMAFLALIEPKPAEWSEEDSSHLTNAILSAEKEWGNESCTAKWLKSLPERFNLQSEPEWSEEDEEMLEYIIGDVNDAKQLYTTQEVKNMAYKEIAWLKSLRPQPKQEWSEEDEKNRRSLNTKEIKVGDTITYFRNGKKGIMLVSSFDSGICPRCKWGITDIDGTAYGDWTPGSGPYYAATEKEKQQLYDTMPIEVKNWLKSLKPHWKPSEEQMGALKKAAEHSFYAGEGAALRILYNDLQKRYGTC